MKRLKQACAFFLMLTVMFAAIPFFAFTVSALEGAGAPTDLTYYAKGVDISYWQAGDTSGSNVNFTKLKASGCEFVILRLAYGQSMDEAFISFYNNARAAGMPLGVYIYGLKTTYAGAASDAQWAIDVFEKYDMYFEYPIFYDIEEKSQLALSSSAATALCEGWCDTLEAAGYFPGIYSGKQFYNLLSSSFKAENDLWIAHVASTDVTAWQFTYNYKDYNAQGYSMWQYAWSNLSNGKYIYDGIYSSGTTKVKDLDIDVCYKNYPEIMKTYGYNNCGSDVKGNLLQSIEKAKLVRYSSYSANEITKLRTAYDNAVKVYNSASSSDSDYKTAMTNLDAALLSGSTVISTGCNYTTSVTARSDAPDSGSELTDGKKTKGDVVTEDGSYVGYNANGDFEITIDLGSAKASNMFTVYTAKGFWGVPLPNDVKISYSDSQNGTYTSVSGSLNSTQVGSGELVDGAETPELYALTYVADSTVNARYIKFTININNYIWIDEVEIASGEAPLSGKIYVNGINSKISSGDCHIFTPSFGTVTGENANHQWTVNVVAKWSDTENGYVVQSVSEGAGSGTPSVTLASDEILIAAHNWETGVTDSTAVPGSAVNSKTLNTLKVGDVIDLSGITPADSYISAASYVSIRTEGESAPVDPSVPDVDENHVHSAGAPATCASAQICLTCGDVLVEATGHTEGDWEDVEDMIVRRCTVCGYVLEAKRADGSIAVEDTETGVLLGDINANGEIDMTDYVLAKRAYFGTYNLTDIELTAADVNISGGIDMTDYVLIKRAYFGTFTIENPGAE